MNPLDQQFKSRHRGGEVKTFLLILTVVLIGTAIALFYYFRTIENLPEKVRKKVSKIYTRFEMPLEKKRIEKKKVPEKIKKKKTVPKKIKKKKKIPTVIKVPPKRVVTKAEPDKRVKKQPRKVYGLKRSYSNGLGSGGSMSDAVVGKVGNTIDKAYDDIKATKADLKGPLVSSATVTQAPRFKKRAKPVITDLMKKNNVEGTIKVRILVDIDGKVKKAVAKNDLGFGSKQAALNACRKMLFTPAQRDGKAVAVWIVVPIRFVKIS